METALTILVVIVIVAGLSIEMKMGRANRIARASIASWVGCYTSSTAMTKRSSVTSWRCAPIRIMPKLIAAWVRSTTKWDGMRSLRIACTEQPTAWAPPLRRTLLEQADRIAVAVVQVPKLRLLHCGCQRHRHCMVRKAAALAGRGNRRGIRCLLQVESERVASSRRRTSRCARRRLERVRR